MVPVDLREAKRILLLLTNKALLLSDRWARRAARRVGQILRSCGDWLLAYGGDRQLEKENVMLAANAARQVNGQSAVAEQPASNKEFVVRLARLALPIWRARRRAQAEAETHPPSRMVLRYLEMAFAELEDAGITLGDYTGEAYEPGMSAFIRTVAWDERPDCATPTIVETIAPAVFYCGRPILRSEVTVGTPPLVETAGAPDARGEQSQLGDTAVADNTVHEPPLTEPAKNGAERTQSTIELADGTADPGASETAPSPAGHEDSPADRTPRRPHRRQGAQPRSPTKADREPIT